MGLFFTKQEDKHFKIGFGRHNNPKRPSNHITTTKYSLITFFPKALILQFTRAANFVYLLSAVLQNITVISSLAPITAIGPLMFVLIVSLIREGFEDYVIFFLLAQNQQKRHSKDKQVNERKTLSLMKGQFKQINWQSIHPGDIIKVLNTQMIPCDMILLYTTQENSICYVETSNLDGETNLKTKYAFTEEIFLYPDQFQLLEGYLEVETPNSQLYDFNGKIKLISHEEKSLAYENLLLRQTHLKNTHQAVGVAVYCGTQSKIMMNKGHIQHKVTKVQKRVNVIQIVLFIILIGLCGTCSVGYYLKHKDIRQKLFYLKDIGISLEFQSILIFFTCFLLLNFLIPVSLNVLLQFTKAFLTLFLGFDKKFKDEFCPDGIHVSNMSIMEELGIIDYVLTDKTGTLTSNKMIFRSCCIQQNVYSTDTLEKNVQILGENSSFHNFWISVVICHDVVKDTLTDKYQGSSPDEVCFVEYARKLGYEFIKRTKNYIEISVRGEKVVYELLHVIPFTLRKRMSVIVKAITSNDQILLFTKGADSAIFQKSLPYKYQTQFENNIDEYAKLGLRTLVFSYRKLKQMEFDQIIEDEKQFRLIKFAKNKTAEEIQFLEKEMIENVQSSLNLLGATAIEDKLQDYVPETIYRLQEAGISVMMITGDKLETAQNIGFLANLMNKDFKIIKVRSNDNNVPDIIRSNYSESHNNFIEKMGVIFEGSSIRKVVEQQNPEIISLYAKFLKKCTSVIFCRSSPQQKALIVNFVRNKLGGVVLAIGDGGNDTGMIQAANVGVGILGRQGNSAAAASDFYFGQFKHLDRLLLHHGRWFYMRISYFFVYYGWKNVIMTIMMFLYILRSSYSGFPAFSEFYISMYNMLIGLIIVGYYGVWDQDVNDDIYPDVWHKLPNLYKRMKESDLFSYKRYIVWTVMGISIAVFLDFFVDLTLGSIDATVSEEGYPVCYEGLYIAKSIILIFVTFSVIIMDIKSFNCCTISIALGICTFGFVIIVYLFQNLQYLGRGYQSLITYARPKIFLVVLVSCGVTYCVKMIINMIQVQIYPSEVDIILRQKKQKRSLALDHTSSIINPKQLSFNLGNFSKLTRIKSEVSESSKQKQLKGKKKLKRQKEQLEKQKQQFKRQKAQLKRQKEQLKRQKKQTYEDRKKNKNKKLEESQQDNILKVENELDERNASIEMKIKDNKTQTNFLNIQMIEE